ncbi:MAG: nucleoside-diphosphate-sugar epimerase [Chlamydiales bacterium]|jgi:nucleoside-diphosphate-sugar epimerase
MDRVAPDLHPEHETPGFLADLCRRPAVARVLVSGGAGFIGAALVQALGSDGIECTVVDDLSASSGARLERLRATDRAPHWFGLDVNRPGAWHQVLTEGGPFDAIVHLAGRVGVRRVLADPEACRGANLAGVRELVAALAKMPPGSRPRVFAASTSEVYADVAGPLREDGNLRSEEGCGRWAYAASKRTAENLLDGASHLWSAGQGPVHLRFFNVVGPGQDARTGMVMPTFVEHALRAEALPVHGRGEQVRAFGHVDDVARTLAELVQSPGFPPGALNLGGRTRTTMLELARTVLARLAEVPGRPLERSGAALTFVDPCRHIAGNFEEVRTREPDLGRATWLGLPIPSRSLIELVDDCLARHSALSIDPASAVRSTALAATPAPHGGIACASLGS